MRRLRRRALKCRPLRYSRQRRACNSLRSNRQALKCPAGAPFLGRRLKGGASAPAAATRQCLARGVFFLSPQLVRLSLAQALGGADLPSGRRPRNGATPGPLSKKCFSFFCAGVASTAVVGTKCPTPRQGRAAQRLRPAMTQAAQPSTGHATIVTCRVPRLRVVAITTSASSAQ